MRRGASGGDVARPQEDHPLAVPGKEAFYRKLGFERMLTAMAIFEDQAAAFERGYLNRN